MKELLKGLEGKKIDVSCGTSAVVRGHVIGIGEEILTLKDEDDNQTFVVIDKIAFVWEVNNEEGRAGFVH